jgi:hypothetical protein
VGFLTRGDIIRRLLRSVESGAGTADAPDTGAGAPASSPATPSAEDEDGGMLPGPADGSVKPINEMERTDTDEL